MANLTRGYTFQSGEQLTPEKLNSLLNDGDVANVSSDDATVVGLGPKHQSAAPTITNGQIWYDTTDNTLKYGFQTPTNASISKYLHALPFREGVFWTFTTVSLGSVVAISRRGSGETQGFATYDGGYFPIVQPFAGDSTATSAHGPWAIATESASGSGPVTCAWTGLVRGNSGGNSVTGGEPMMIDHTTNQFQLTTGAVPAQASVLGVIMEDSANTAASEPVFLLWNTGPAIQDIVA